MRLCAFLLMLFCSTGLLVFSGCGPSHMSERAASDIEEDETYDEQVNPEGFQDADDEGGDSEDEDE